MKLRSKNIILGSLAASTLMLLCLGGCNGTVEEACKKKIPEFQNKLKMARNQVKKNFDEESGRSLASFEASGEIPPEVLSPAERVAKETLTLEQKAQWQDWTEDRLREVETYLDAVKGEVKLGRVYAPVHDELNAVANELVSFDGFTSRSQMKFMLQSLDSAQKHVDRAIELACPAEPEL